MKRLHLIGLVLGLSLLLAACASGGAGQPSATLSVEMTDFKFSPAEATVFAGQETTLQLSNSGAIEHDFTILKKGVQVSGHFDPVERAGDILVEFKLKPGESQTFKFTLPEAGEYQLVCNLSGHLEAGMGGQLHAVTP